MIRRASDRFLLVTGTAFGVHDRRWIEGQAPRDGTVYVSDVTSAFACFGLWGPRARDILQPLTKTSLANEDFRYLTAQEVSVGLVPCLAVRVTYVGELGWELYCPTEYGLRLWDTLWEAGREHGLVARRLPRDRRASPREGLPGLGHRPDARADAGRGRAGVRGQARQGRVPRP